MWKFFKAASNAYHQTHLFPKNVKQEKKQNKTLNINKIYLHLGILLQAHKVSLVTEQ